MEDSVKMKKKPVVCGVWGNERTVLEDLAAFRSIGWPHPFPKKAWCRAALCTPALSGICNWSSRGQLLAFGLSASQQHWAFNLIGGGMSWRRDRHSDSHLRWGPRRWRMWEGEAADESSKYGHPSVGSRTPADSKSRRCSSPLYKIV